MCLSGSQQLPEVNNPESGSSAQLHAGPQQDINDFWFMPVDIGLPVGVIDVADEAGDVF
ncbi:hypothetical protein F5J12DRAFT_889564 [Pisolithus orientalis]|uniref:uncharacterized protein n=1 Tax=Pisolithus orientalis TaxID=936130 RepID=UPI002224BF7D|nr:uncharacterized protein F5J12DRAFT_889564 [Pisolithus orientalis]KAI6025675.1 hypothetical protein F5J12DRAFT_889564 [Pisolithus orientalis]